jgi:hypothetical protein
MNLFLDEEWDKVEALRSCRSKNAEARSTHRVHLMQAGAVGEWSAWVHGSVIQNVRPHIWYFAASQCDEDHNSQFVPVQLEYEIHMFQEDLSEFSIEMRWMMTLNSMVLLCLVAFIVRYWGHCQTFIKSAGKLHPVIWVLIVSIGLQFAAQSLHTLHLWKYRSDGVGMAFIDLLSEVLLMLSQVVQTTLLIALGSGYTLLPSRSSCLIVVKWIAFISLIIHVALVSFGKMLDESHCKYHENEGAVGWVLLSIRVMLLGWFLFATQDTQRLGGLRLHDFLQRFQIAGSIYFLAFPALFLLVQVFAPYLQHPIMQIGLLVMQTTSNAWLAELFLSRGTYFKVSALSSSLLPGSSGTGMFDKTV